MTKRLGPVLIAVLVALLAGCGSGNKTTKNSTSTPTTPESGAAKLERGVRTALAENRQLSVYVLWNNKIPSWAEHSTRGPALAGLRAAAADRRKRGIRVRLLSDRFQVLSIRLAPSYTGATAIARGRQHVRPYHVSGKPAGRPVALNERARIELRRLGRTNRFIVWKVELLP